MHPETTKTPTHANTVAHVSLLKRFILLLIQAEMRQLERHTLNRPNAETDVSTREPASGWSLPMASPEERA